MSKVNIIMYHYVRDLKLSRYPNIKGLELKHFKEQLEFLTSRFTIIRMEDLLSVIYGGGYIPDNAALLTFDDGYIDHYLTVFPILSEMGIQGSFFPPSKVLEKNVLLDINKIHFILASSDTTTIFNALLNEIDFYRGTEFVVPSTVTLLAEYAIPTRFDSREVVFIKRMLQTVLQERLRESITDKFFKQFVGINEAVFAKELYCDVAQLAAIKRSGMFIGLHGYSHEWLGKLEKTEYEMDISRSVNFMDSIGLIDKNSWVMCYPSGSWSEGVVHYIEENGCLAAVTTEVAIADLQTHNRFLLPRLDTNDYSPKRKNYIENFSKKVFHSVNNLFSLCV